MQSIVAKNSQNLFDLAIMHCGTLEDSFTLAMMNGLSLFDDVVVGQELTAPAQSNKSVVEYLSVNNHMPATNERDVPMPVDGGIGFMIIGTDFIIG